MCGGVNNTLGMGGAQALSQFDPAMGSAFQSVLGATSPYTTPYPSPYSANNTYNLSALSPAAAALYSGYVGQGPVSNPAMTPSTMSPMSTMGTAGYPTMGGYPAMGNYAAMGGYPASPPAYAQPYGSPVNSLAASIYGPSASMYGGMGMGTGAIGPNTMAVMQQLGLLGGGMGGMDHGAMGHSDMGMGAAASTMAGGILGGAHDHGAAGAGGMAGHGGGAHGTLDGFTGTAFTDEFQEAHMSAGHLMGAGGTVMFDAAGTGNDAADLNTWINELGGNIRQGGGEIVLGVDAPLAAYRAQLDKVLKDDPDLINDREALYNKVAREIQNVNDLDQIEDGMQQDGIDTSGFTDTMLHWTDTALVDATGTDNTRIEVHQGTEDEDFNRFTTFTAANGRTYAALISRSDNGGGDTNNFNNAHNYMASAVVMWDTTDANAPTNLQEALDSVEIVDNDDTSGLSGNGEAIVDQLLATGEYKGAEDNGGEVAEGMTSSFTVPNGGLAGGHGDAGHGAGGHGAGGHGGMDMGMGGMGMGGMGGSTLGSGILGGYDPYAAMNAMAGGTLDPMSALANLSGGAGYDPYSMGGITSWDPTMDMMGDPMMDPTQMGYYAGQTGASSGGCGCSGTGASTFDLASLYANDAMMRNQYVGNLAPTVSSQLGIGMGMPLTGPGAGMPMGAMGGAAADGHAGHAH